MELLYIKLGGKRDDLQSVKYLVPLCHVSLNRNVCGPHRRFSVGYCDEEFPLQETIFLDTRDIDGTKD